MNELIYYHAVALAAHGDWHQIKNYRGTAVDWETVYRAIKEGGIPVADAWETFDKLESSDVRLVLREHKEYPEPLRHIAQPPFGIYVRGTLPSQWADENALSSPGTVAIVGTRRATADGKHTAHTFAHALSRAGFVIASGLAFGIDAAAHEGALAAGSTPTIAVLAGGLDNVYPGSHAALAQKILDHDGALISEYPPGEEAYAYRFIERNRIISGVSRGVIVVEAPESSGALATARYAFDQNREVFVVPGNVNTNAFKGSNALIRQGAELVTTPDDILSEYHIVPSVYAAAHDTIASPEKTLILKALADISAPADVDKLIAMTKLEPQTVSRTLSLLIIEGIIKETDRGYTI